jgi:hypothetical protein
MAAARFIASGDTTEETERSASAPASAPALGVVAIDLPERRH